MTHHHQRSIERSPLITSHDLLAPGAFLSAAPCVVLWRRGSARPRRVTGVQVPRSYELLITGCGVAGPPHLFYGTREAKV